MDKEKFPFVVTWSGVERRGIAVGQSDHPDAGIYIGRAAPIRAYSEGQARGIIASRIRRIYGRDVFIVGLIADQVRPAQPTPHLPSLTPPLTPAPVSREAPKAEQLALFTHRVRCA